MLPIYDKVAASGWAGLVSTLIIFVLGLLHVTPAAPLVAAITVVVMFAAGYLKTETKIGKTLAPLADDVYRAIVEQEGPVKP